MPALLFTEVKTRELFNYLADSFIHDNSFENLNPEASGWRILAELARNSGLATSRLHGRTGGQIGSSPLIKELLSGGYVEIKTFPGERGHGGEVTRFRVRYENDCVKSYVKTLSVMKSEVMR
jgi:hypothetical protein